MDRHIRVQEIAKGAGGLRAPIVETVGVNVVPPSTVVSVPVNMMVAGVCGTLYEGLHVNVNNLAP